MAEKPRITSRVSLLKIDRIRKEKRAMIYRERENKRQKLSDYDLISRLPDDILLLILSRLSMKDVIRTSILSTTWKKLWRKYLRSLKNLDFDIASLDMPLVHKDAFVRCVDRIFHLHCGTIESFRMINRYLFTRMYAKHIDRWIKLAMKKKVEKIELNLSRDIQDKLRWEYWKCYTFPNRLFTDEGEEEYYSTLKHLSLTYCILNPPSDSKAFNSLKSLSLKDCCVTQERLLNILSCCSPLEWLRMENCRCEDVMTFASTTLKHLNIHCCHILSRVDISGVENLTSFEYGGSLLPREDLEWSSTSGLPVKRLSFHILREYALANADYVFNGIASDFPRIESLILTLPPIFEMSANVASFTHLKQLVLILHFEHLEKELTYIALKASPNLHKLELHFPTSMGDDRQIEEISSEPEGSFRHDNLKEVAMYNFQGQAREVELLMYLANCAPSIKKIQISRSVLSYEGDGEWCHLNYGLSKIKRSQVFEMLHKRLPAAIKLQVS